MTDEALARAEANFAAAKEACRTGHSDAEGVTCTYGGMSSAHGYWLAAEDCGLSHGEVCDLRAACDGADTQTGFRGREGSVLVDDWIWRVTACQPCADLYVAAHPEWRRPDPDEPPMSYEEALQKLHEQVEADRAAMNPAEREASDMVTNLMLYGQHPAPTDPPQFTGLAGLFGDSITLEPVATPVRDGSPAPPGQPWLGYILPPETAGDPFWNAVVNGPPKPPEPEGTTSTGLFSALGGVTPSAPDWRAELDRVWNDTTLRPGPPRPAWGGSSPVLDWRLRTDEARNGPLGRAQWAPPACICPWPWPLDGEHVRLDCPHRREPTKPVVGRNPQVGCRKVDASWIHGRPHDCPIHARGAR